MLNTFCMNAATASPACSRLAKPALRRLINMECALNKIGAQVLAAAYLTAEGKRQLLMEIIDVIRDTARRMTDSEPESEALPLADGEHRDA